MILVSTIKEHEGLCKPVWLNENQVMHRLDGGVTGFFRLVKKIPYLPFYYKFGEEFHGIIPHGSLRVVESK